MIGFDTNVLVRYFTQDDAIQSPKSTLLIESLIVIVELVWVLSSARAKKLPRYYTICYEHVNHASSSGLKLLLLHWPVGLVCFCARAGCLSEFIVFYRVLDEACTVEILRVKHAVQQSS